MKPYWESLIRLVYPSQCAACRVPLDINREGICGGCQHALDEVKYPTEDQILAQNFESIDQGWSLYPYESPVKEILTGVKFYGKRWLIKLFAPEIQKLTLALGAEHTYDYLIPIPVDLLRLSQREYNQTEIIASHICRMTNIPVKTNILVKRIHTAPQGRLSREERKYNLKYAFRVRRKEMLAGRSILLVDDILTTGATAEIAAEALKDAGAKRVDLITLARTELKS